MNKAYIRINWENWPSVKSPLNEQNLNHMDGALDVLDDRVIVLDTTKASLIELSTLFKDVSFEDKTGILTFTRYNGATVTIDTPLEKVALNIYYDPETEKLILPLVDGTQTEVDLSRLITEFEFVDSDTIAFSVSVDGKVSAIVKEGSIGEKHLRPNYLADIKVEAGKAAASATAAAGSADAADKSAQDAAGSADAAKTSEENAEKSAEESKDAANSTGENVTKAENAATAAAGSADAADKSAQDAAGSADAAKTSEENAEKSAANAAASEESVANNAAAAEQNALLAKSWAVDGTGIREGEETDNAKYYCQTAHGFRDESERFSQSAEDAVEQINKKLEMAEFDIDDDGNLIYTDNSSYDFTVDDNGDLNWEVVA